jgi:hypothetical protein
MRGFDWKTQSCRCVPLTLPNNSSTRSAGSPTIGEPNQVYGNISNLFAQGLCRLLGGRYQGLIRLPLDNLSEFTDFANESQDQTSGLMELLPVSFLSEAADLPR